MTAPRWRITVVTVAVCGLGIVHATRGQAGNPEPVIFTDITRAAGIDFVHVNGASPEKHLAETMGSGALLFDYDNDGWLDILLIDSGSLADKAVAGRARHRLYRNLRNSRFTDVSATSGIRNQAFGMGGCAGDFDNDGWVDVYVTGVGPNSLYRNNHTGAFTDVTRAAGVGSPLWSTSCAFFDMDRDGDLDLFVTNYVNASLEHAPFCGNAQIKARSYCHPLNFQPLPNIVYRNNGNGTFIDATAETGIARFRGNGLGVVVTDVDDDRWPDVVVANDSMPNFLFLNEGGAKFNEGALLAGVAVAIDGAPRAGMGTDAGDYDGDGRLDLIVTNLDLETHSLFRNMGGRLFTYTTAVAGLAAPTRPFVGFGVAWIDYDNDGALDLAIANGHVLDDATLVRAGAKHAQRSQLFHNVGGRFVEAGRSEGSALEKERVGRGLAVGDIDNDGDLDLLLTSNGGSVALLRNDGGNARNALVVQTVSASGNRDGVGARVTVTAAARTQVREIRSGSSYLSQNDMRAHFGVGPAAQIERLEVRWPSGRVSVAENLPVNQIVTVREGTGITRRTPFARKADE